MKSLSLLILLSVTFLYPANAQNTSRSNEVLGMAGTVNVIPSPAGTHTVVVFSSNTPVSTTSSQIVFVLQVDGTSLPPAWSGEARVMVGDGFLGIIPNDSSSNARFLFMFRDREIPESLASGEFQLFETVGIARYGETTPLKDEQISALVQTGRGCSSPVAKQSENTSSGELAEPLSTVPLKAVPLGTGGNFCTNCAAGGSGSTGCSAGGCSVSCQSGWYSCCNGSGTCACCRNP
jgi:hypothetical protein